MADFRDRIPNIKALASTLGSDYSHLHHVLKGAIPPSVRLAKRIEAATNGLIRWTEFFEAGPAVEDVHDVPGVVDPKPEHEDHPAHVPASKPEAA